MISSFFLCFLSSISEYHRYFTPECLTEITQGLNIEVNYTNLSRALSTCNLHNGAKYYMQSQYFRQCFYRLILKYLV